ncbi:DUF6301 family protein [Microbacterium phyllosphaerae]|uniref:DUF6301 family protein n=1 Tax=Microbacterium phyllosphaerae TaxID=124798 RepID=UPI0021685038|nr:DUF6301 family protein [Microbacterium phyllosphaerae]MCS3442555.1 hypothetical protein [Microbacterium phyllosphaerae]
MSWKAMTPTEVCDIVDFWTAAPWPLTEDEAQQLAVERFGWSIEVENGTRYLMNTVTGLALPDVMTIAVKDQMRELSFDTTDTIRDVTPESTAFLGDNFALMVREGEARWGKPDLRRTDKWTTARWDAAGGSRVAFNFLPRGLNVRFETPQGADVERKLGDR